MAVRDAKGVEIGPGQSASLTTDRNSLLHEAPMHGGLFAGGGELGERMRNIDWSETPLGPVGNWPQSLKTCIRIILTSAQPMFVWWGDQMINLYNDAYKTILGGKHPGALGQPASVVWREIWDQIVPRASSAMERNEGTYDESLLLIMERYGYPEETYYTFSYSPVPNDQGGTGGIICANTEDTQRIISERQLSLLRALAADTANARTWKQACRLSATSLGKNRKDICFAAIYILDSARQTFKLAGSSGIKAGDQAAPREILSKDETIWPLGRAADVSDGIVVEDLKTRFADIPSGSWEESPSKAVLLPIPSSAGASRAGVLVVGLNPFRKYDDNYRGFLRLAAGQISASIANAQAYEEEKRRAEALAELDRAKTAFFSNVSHELRTPLTLMLGPLEDEIKRASLAPSQRQSWELLHRNALRLLKLVNALLDFSRLEAGRMQVSYRPTNLAEFTAELSSVFEAAVERAGLRLKIDAPPLPHPVYVDHEMWEKIVLNLVSNAFKSTFDGEIEVRIEDGGDGADLIVRDTGTGISEAEIPHLFERFRRIEGARRRTHEGSGIGLALVNELVHMHGGTIVVSSKLDVGSEFRVHIPYGVAHLPQDRVSTTSDAPAGSRGVAFVQEALSWVSGTDEVADVQIDSSDLGSTLAPAGTGGRILLVDDNRDMREYLRRLLGKRFEVRLAANGKSALEIAINDPPDLVLTDVMMPVMDGFQLLKELRSDARTQLVPVIMLSARAGEESRVEGMEAGADDYLVKPFTARELLARVEAHLRMSRLRAEFYDRRSELERQLSQVANAVENLSDGFQTFDADWRYTYINPAGEQLGRLPKEEVLGRSIWELYPELVGTVVETECRRAVREQTPVEFEYFHLVTQRWFKLRVYPTAEGGAALYSRETTELRKAEDALRKAEQLAVVGRLAASISHELNNPLEAVTNLLFLAKTADGEQAQSLLELADKEVRRLSHITSRSLKFYRQSSLPSSTQLREILESVLFFYEPRLRSRNIKVERRYEQAPDIFCQPGELQQVFANLVSNALDAMSDGGRLILSISSAPARNGSLTGGVRVSVADTGLGMFEEAKRRLFEPFFTTKGEMGTGLGLWVSREILDKHHATVRLRSKPGCGTVFSLTFPVDAISVAA